MARYRNSITKAVGDMLCKAPPRLKPRPPGPLSNYYDEGSPSSAGPTTNLINSISHRVRTYIKISGINLFIFLFTAYRLFPRFIKRNTT